MRLLKVILISLFLLPSLCFAQNTDSIKRKQLAVISAYNEAAPWPRTYISLITHAISKRTDFNIASVAHLNNIITYDEKTFNRLCDDVFCKLNENKPDYLVLIGNFAFTLRDRIKKEWGDIPMLLIAQNNKYGPLDYYLTKLNASDTLIPPVLKPLEDLQKDYNFSMVQTPNKTKETVDMMIQMFPNMRKLVFMSDPLYLNRDLSHKLREYLKLKYPDVEYEWLVADDDTSMQPYLNNLDYNVGLLLSTWYYVSPGADGFPHMRSGDSYLIESASRPVFGLRYSYLPYGIIGGYFASQEETEKNVLEALNDLISDKNMSSIPFREPSISMPIFDYSRMESLGIDESICPENTVFINKPKTAWETYSLYVYVGAAVCFILIVSLAVCIVLEKRKQKIGKAYDNLVSSMPIGYVKAVLKMSSNGTVEKVSFDKRNKKLVELSRSHELKSIANIKDKVYWQEIADSMLVTTGTKSSILRTPDGNTYIEFIVCPESRSSDSRIDVDVFVLDVSDKVKVEQTLREAANKAVESDNMKSIFLANISHEIRTPLNTIVGFSELLCKTDDVSKKKKYMNIIDANNKLLLKIIGDILDISKVQSDNLELNMGTVDVNKLITYVCSGVDMSDYPNVHLLADPEDSECLVTSDCYRLSQILYNLVVNALKYTPSGSITVGYRVTGETLRFFVKDTGVGISAADMGSVFKRFINQNLFVQSIGLDLYISKIVIEKLGGALKVESEGRGKGTTMSFAIPYVLDKNSRETVKLADNFVHEENEETHGGDSSKSEFDAVHGEVEDKEDSLPSYKPERKKLLVVEDNADNYELYVALLDGRYDLVRAWNGEEAVQLFAKESPDLVIMDICIPFKNGYEATSEIRMLSKTVPVVAVSACSQPDERDNILAKGFNAFLTKPIKTELFLRTIRNLL